MLCQVNSLLREQIVKKLKMGDLHNLCLTNKECHAKYCKDSRLWTSLMKTQVTSNRLVIKNPILDYYLNKVNVYAIGENVDNMFGVSDGKTVLTQLTPILSGVKKLIMSYGATFAIKYDQSLYFMGDAAVNHSLNLSENVKDIVIGENYVGSILKLDGRLYQAGVGSPEKIMNNIRKIYNVPGTNDFLAEDDNNLYLITYDRPPDIIRDNLEIKFKNYETFMINGMILKVTIWAQSKHYKSVKYFDDTYIITDDNSLYNIPYGIKIANDVISVVWMQRNASPFGKHTVCWSSKNGDFNVSVNDYGINSKFENIFSIKFDIPIVKFHMQYDSCILLLENGRLLFGGNISQNLKPLLPSGKSFSYPIGDLISAVSHAIPVLDDIKDFQVDDDDEFLAVVKNL